MLPAIELIRLNGDVPVTNLFISKPMPAKTISSSP